MFQLYVQSEHHLIASYQNIFITVWWELPTVADLQESALYRRPFAEKFSKYALLTVVRIDRPRRLSADARALSEQMRREMGEACLAEASVIDSGGALAFTLAQLLFSAMNMLNRTKHPSQMFSSLEEGIRWLAPLVNASLDTKDLFASLSHACQRHPRTNAPPR